MITKTPWEVLQCSEDEGKGDKNYCISSVDGGCVGYWHTEDNGGKWILTKDDANLIASSPALLEALEGVMNYIKILTESNDYEERMIAHMDFTIVREKAIAAIKLARGE